MSAKHNAGLALRPIWLCADDYGISPAVNAGIRELIARGRLNATSAMTAAPHLDGGQAQALQALNAGAKRVLLGLHVTLTAPFVPRSADFTPLRHGHFLPQPQMMRAAMARRLKPDVLAGEIGAQLRTFIALFGAPPDFLDGHQHVHLLPQVRDAFLKVAAAMAPHAWVRQCNRPRSGRRLRERKALALDVLNLGLKRKAHRLGIATNPAFAGAYDFNSGQNFARLFPRFLAGLPEGGLIMCHPGHVDAALEQLDSLTTQREREFAYFNSEDFPRALAEHGYALAHPEAN
jgi:predicted glycoside hydrolase/deacetylase ChbG (UPF0249 family)